MCEVLDKIEARGFKRGYERAYKIAFERSEIKGVNKMRALIRNLLAQGRQDDIMRVLDDEEYCNKLLAELKAE